MVDKFEIRLIKQSLDEANQYDTQFLTDISKLDLVGMVSGSSTKVPFSREAINEINEQIRLDAKGLEAQYVFGIEYRAMAGSNAGGTIGYGDAYKIKE